MRFAGVALVALAVVAGVIGYRSLDRGGPDAALLDERSGGDTTAFDLTDNAFGLSARNLGRDERRVFEIGDSLFTQNWVTAPSSTSSRDGLGPLLNAQACGSCHVKDGRARPPDGPDDPERGLLLRLSILGDGGTQLPEPRYGGQLQDRAVLGVTPEGQFEITYGVVRGEYGDGTPFELRVPSYAIVNLAYGPMRPDVMVSPRIAQQLVGMGLLEAIPESEILARADPDDRDGDGISGRPNRVHASDGNDNALGRFGWKANVATIADQAAGAFRGDIGITSSRAPEEPCTKVQTVCLGTISGGSPEIDDDTLSKLVFYVHTLAVPGRRDTERSEVREGARHFEDLGCAACHTVTYRTGNSPFDAVSNQTIHPYTDLLLHDMGPGLSDGRPDGEATAEEWRTAPLWGIGLVDDINDHTNFLHDGRARNLAEAILWHGGEAKESSEGFRMLGADDRAALIAFLESL
jgi:CxxC motif-containing protein (DUF1111 family)